MYFLSEVPGAYYMPISVTPCTLTIFTWLSFKKRTIAVVAMVLFYITFSSKGN
jgi:hypothetical protein